MPKILTCHNVDIRLKLISAYSSAESSQKDGTDIAKQMIFRLGDTCAPVQPPFETHVIPESELPYIKASPQNQSFFTIFGDNVAAKLKYFQNEEFQCLHPSIICSLCFSKILRSLILVIPTYNHLRCIPEYLANIPNLAKSFCNWC